MADGGSRKIVVVLGMHRSGTSLLAHALHAVGVELGGTLLAADEHNQDGYWEHAEIMRVHEELLEALDRAWWRSKGSLPFPAEWWREPKVQPFKAALTAVVERELERTPRLWGFKDPRTSRLLPLWKEIFADLGCEPVYLLAVRHPSQVAASLAKRDAISPARAQLLWLQHNLDALRETRGALGSVIDYERWFTHADEQAAALVDALALIAPGEEPAARARVRTVLRPALCHESARAAALLPFVEETYALLVEAAACGRPPERLFAIAAEVERAATLLHAWAEVIESPPEDEPAPGIRHRLSTLEGELERWREREPDLKRLQALEPEVERLRVLEPEVERLRTLEPEVERLRALEPDVERLRDVADELARVRLLTRPASEHGRRAAPLPNLPANPRARAGRPARVCIASGDLVGPVRNGGIGTAYTNLAERLAAAGHEVTLLYLLGERCENGSAATWTTHYERKGIRFVPLPARPNRHLIAAPNIAIAYRAFEWLREQQFDVIHFPEWRGHGYYCALAKHQGLAFAHTVLCVGIHSPTLWQGEGNAELLQHVEELELDFMERQSLALADVAWSPSQYLVRWVAEQGWALPERTFVQPYVLSAEVPRAAVDGAALRRVEEIVFFGRLEHRKGLELFCDALDRLAAEGVPDLRVTFLGKGAQLGGRPSEDWVRDRAARWPWEWTILTDRTRDQAATYLRREGCLAVVASLLENSPNTVYECLAGGVPLLASKVGGIPELLAPDAAARACFDLDAGALAAKIRDAVLEGVRPATPAIDFDTNEQVWIGWHEDQASVAARAVAAPPAAEPAALPLVSVCLTHFNRPACVRQALWSLRAQDYPRLEVVLVDDGSDDPEAVRLLAELEPEFRARDWQLIRQENRYLGAARNTAAFHARGEYLLFMDDDNVAKPHQVSTFVRVAQRTGAHLLTCVSDLFRGERAPGPEDPSTELWLPIGAAVPVGVFWNCFGDANALVRRDVFQAIGGFTEERGVTYEDVEFLARAALMGFRLELVPEPLFWYRVAAGSMLRRTDEYANRMRGVRPYLEAVPEALRTLVLFAQGLKFRHDQLLSARPAPAAAETRPPVVPAEIEVMLRGARLLAQLDRADVARELVTSAIESAGQLGDTEVVLHTLLDAARTLADVGEVGSAGRALEQALALRNGHGDAGTHLQVLLSSGRVLAAAGQAQEGCQAAHGALDLARKRNDTLAILEGLLLAGRTHAALGEARAAREMLMNAVNVAFQIRDWTATANALLTAGELLPALGDEETAARSLATARKLAHETNSVAALWRAEKLAARVHPRTASTAAASAAEGEGRI